jgi:hypothetical protein
VRLSARLIGSSAVSRWLTIGAAQWTNEDPCSRLSVQDIVAFGIDLKEARHRPSGDRGHLP